MIKTEKRVYWRRALEILGCSKSTLYRLIKSGEIRIYGIGNRNRFFYESELKAYFENKNVAKGYKNVED